MLSGKSKQEEDTRVSMRKCSSCCCCSVAGRLGWARLDRLTPSLEALLLGVWLKCLFSSEGFREAFLSIFLNSMVEVVEMVAARTFSTPDVGGWPVGAARVFCGEKRERCGTG